MKRFCLFVFVLLLFMPVFAANGQKTYLVDSQEWIAASALAIATGYNPPTAVSPVTAGEIISTICNLPSEALSGTEREFSSNLLSVIEKPMYFSTDNFGISPTIILSPEIYAHQTITSRASDYAFMRKDRLSPLNFSFRFDFAEAAYGYVDYLTLSPRYNLQYDKTFGTNMDSLLQGQSESTLKTGVSVGNSWFNFLIARDRQSQGYGKTGNFSIGDNFSKQDFMRFHTNAKWFDYTLTLTHYDTMTGGTTPESLHVNHSTFNSMHQILSFHRFEAKFLNKMRFAFVEGAMFYMNNSFDWRLLNPFIYTHGLYNFSQTEQILPGDEANNMMIIEGGIAIIPHLRANFQVIIDQIQMASEYGEDDPNVFPNAYGALLNLESAWILSSKEYLSFWVEGAYTSPYLYLNLKKDGDNYNHNYDMIVGSHFLWEAYESEIGYSGYKYGGDAIVAAIGMDYGMLDVFHIDASLMYMIHGPYGFDYKNILLNKGYQHLNDITPYGGIDKAEHRIQFDINGSYTPIDGVEIICGARYINIWNYKTDLGKSFSDIQFKLGASLDIMALFV